MGYVSTTATGERWWGDERGKGGLLTEAHEKVGDVHHVRRVSGGVVVHFVLFPGPVLDDVQENIDGRVAVLGSRAVPTTGTGRRRE